MDATAIAAEMLEPHLDRASRPLRPTLRPLDGDDAARRDQIVEAEIGDLGGRER